MWFSKIFTFGFVACEFTTCVCRFVEPSAKIIAIYETLCIRDTKSPIFYAVSGSWLCASWVLLSGLGFLGRCRMDSRFRVVSFALAFGVALWPVVEEHVVECVRSMLRDPLVDGLG